ncbi:unnamed protein product [Effrenium voratum]|nr:unnamed protein product [Effrenium voratum]
MSDLKTIWIKGWRRKMASLSLLAHDNLLLQVGSKVGLSVGKQDPSCGNEFCENLYPGSWLMVQGEQWALPMEQHPLRMSSDIELLISVCRLHGFKRAIVFIGSVQWDWQTFQAKELPHQEAFVSLFAALRAAGILPLACYYLNDGPNDLSNWQRAADVVSAVHEFNQAFPASAVEGIEGDQEPTSISAEYLQMNEMIRARRDQLNAQLKLSVSLKPGWLRRTYQEENMVSAALGALDVGMIMAYSSSPSTSQAWGDQALARATETNKKLTVAIETSPRAPQSDTFWEVASQEKPKFFQMLADMEEHYRLGADGEAFQGLVVHDYEGFFEAMYGIKATSYPSPVTHLYA